MQMFVLVLVVLTPICLANCPVDDNSENGGLPRVYGLRLSVKNETSSVFTVKLVVGEIPSENARFDELHLIPDEYYKLRNPDWFAELGTECVINPGNYGFVYNNLPFSGLGEELISYHPIDTEKWNEMLDKLISFTFTISRGSEIVYRAAGWDVPEDDMATYQINDKMWGIYDTAVGNYYDEYGQRWVYPRLTSKLFPWGESGFISSLTYFIRAAPTGDFLVEMNPYSTHVTEKDYWE